MNHNRKILVIGAGIAGSTICYWLKKYGFNPTLIERSKQIRTGGQAIDILGISKETLEQRSSVIMEKIKMAANAISLPDYV